MELNSSTVTKRLIDGEWTIVGERPALLSRPKVNVRDPESILLDDLVEMDARFMEAVIRRMSIDHKTTLLAECEVRVYQYEGITARTSADIAPRGFERFPTPYAMLKKWSYIYSCLAGYQTNADLEQKLAAKRFEEGQREHADGRMGLSDLVGALAFLRKG